MPISLAAIGEKVQRIAPSFSVGRNSATGTRCRLCGGRARCCNLPIEICQRRCRGVRACGLGFAEKAPPALGVPLHSRSPEMRLRTPSSSRHPSRASARPTPRQRPPAGPRSRSRDSVLAAQHQLLFVSTDLDDDHRATVHFELMAGVERLRAFAHGVPESLDVVVQALSPSTRAQGVARRVHERQIDLLLSRRQIARGKGLCAALIE